MAQLAHLPADSDIAAIQALLDRDGAVIIDDVMTPALLAQLRAELAPFIAQGNAGRDEFSGFRTRRIGALMARSAACRDLALDPLVNAACAAWLGPYCDGYQLHFTQATSIGAGETPQMLHRDRGVWGGHISRKIETQFSTIWAVTDFTAANGATRVVPGSQRWAAGREAEPHEIAAAEMTAGSVLLYTGSVLHGGGPNETNAFRTGVLLHYTLGWLRQEENQYLSCPPEIARDFSPELRALIGYSKGGYTLGFFSTPNGPGEPGLETAPPEMLFGEKPLPKFDQRFVSARELIQQTS
ncbi:MAG: mitomycin antibiotic biosynthesis protein [Alphaproteobacteria bacterium PA4]|nr:MAG: mitomycin antibiotic biosynthesis protein [Alphaproteobacteria bacterium PA4]